MHQCRAERVREGDQRALVRVLINAGQQRPVTVPRWNAITGGLIL